MIDLKNARWIAVLCLVVIGLPGGASAQSVVTSNEARVVADGDFVRIETQEGVTEVKGDWRKGVTVAEADGLIVQLGAERVGDIIHLNLAGDVLFELGSSRITARAGRTLGDVARLIRSSAMGEVLAIGHTDSLGDLASNQQLSEDRATAVLRWLHEREGIPLEILVARGLGERQPVAANTTADGRDNPEGRARNRRVEFFVGASKHADVRTASVVTVKSASGDVRISEDHVDVGENIRIDANGVQVGDLNLQGAGYGSASDSKNCSAGKICEAGCREGNCRMTCSAGANCDYSCLGGDCEMLCAAGAVCDFSCSGGDCRFSCAAGSTCDTSCSGGDCSR